MTGEALPIDWMGVGGAGQTKLLDFSFGCKWRHLDWEFSGESSLQGRMSSLRDVMNIMNPRKSPVAVAPRSWTERSEDPERCQDHG